jgi:hypothetical protein
MGACAERLEKLKLTENQMVQKAAELEKRTVDRHRPSSCLFACPPPPRKPEVRCAGFGRQGWRRSARRRHSWRGSCRRYVVYDVALLGSSSSASACPEQRAPWNALGDAQQQGGRMD